MKKAILAAFLLCASLLLCACGGGTESAGEAPNAQKPAPASSSDIASPAAPVPASSSDIAAEQAVSAVRAAFLEDYGKLGEHDEFVASSTSDAQVQIVYSAQGKVTDFCVLSLFLTDFVDGKPVFEEETLYRQDRLPENRPLVVTLTFVGDLPNNGISYVNSEGETVRMSLSTSGLDGSLFLEAY